MIFWKDFTSELIEKFLTHPNLCMLSQYDSALGQGYVQLIQTIDEVCSDFDDFEISCDSLLTSYF